MLSAEERALLDEGVRLFNAGLYFECHDVLEDMWNGVRGPSRDFFQGLIQVAVAFHHLGNANLAGADSMLSRALARLAKYPDRYCGFELAAHRTELEGWRARIADGRLPALTLEALPKWRFA